MTSQPDSAVTSTAEDPLWFRILWPCLTALGVLTYALLFGGLLWFGTVVFTEPSRQCWVQPLGALSCAPPEAAWRPLTMTLLAAPLGLLSVLGKALAQRFLPKH